MRTTPQISIIIPAYNEAKYINACLASIFAQVTDFQYQVIVVDNNSSDVTAKIAAKWPVQLITEKKPGATVARNTGARAAKSNILYFVDADCRLPAKQLQKICNAFQNDRTIDLIAGPYIYDQDGFWPEFVTNKLRYFLVHHWLFKLFTGVDQFPGGNFAIKKKPFTTVGGFDESICNQEYVLPDDVDLAMRLRAEKVKALYDWKFVVFSSFRRVKQSPIKHTLVRLFATVTLLRGRKLQ